MGKLILFDIDGTLISARSVKADLFTEAINDTYDLGVKLDWDHFGLTDKIIMERLLRDAGWADEKIEAVIPELLKKLDRLHDDRFDPSTVEVMKGVKPLLEALHQYPEAQLGLITGNIEPGAKRKLDAVGLWRYFNIGGFGSDPHLTRADLVAVAMAKADCYDTNEVFVIGDTPRDIFAARDAGVKHSIGVANGLRDINELIDAGAEAVFEDFSDTRAVLNKLGI